MFVYMINGKQPRTITIYFEMTAKYETSDITNEELQRCIMNECKIRNVRLRIHFCLSHATYMSMGDSKNQNNNRANAV